MRITWIVPAAMLAMVVSNAWSQNLCPGQFETCMGACFTGPKARQDRCIEACQAKDSQCYVQHHGPRPKVISDAPKANAAAPRASAEAPQPAGGERAPATDAALGKR